jgi:hypothetical protein
MRTTILLAIALSFALSGCAAKMFPAQVSAYEPGPSASTTKAQVGDAVRIVRPEAQIPPDQARWSGSWSGWMGQGKFMDTRLVVVQAREDAVLMFYSNSNNGRNYSATLKGKFDLEQLTATLPSGATVNYRMRNPDVLEIAYRGKILGAQFENWMYGVLTKDKADTDARSR